jgi:hypothetical protein
VILLILRSSKSVSLLTTVMMTNQRKSKKKLFTHNHSNPRQWAKAKRLKRLAQSSRKSIDSRDLATKRMKFRNLLSLLLMRNHQVECTCLNALGISRSSCKVSLIEVILNQILRFLWPKVGAYEKNNRWLITESSRRLR